MEFGGVRVLRGRKYGAQALAKECRIIPRSKWRTTVQLESEADRGELLLRVKGVSIELPVPVMVDWLMGFTSIQNSFEGTCLGLVFGCDGAAMTGKTGVVATSMWMLNLPKLPQSANHTFTVYSPMARIRVTRSVCTEWTSTANSLIWSTIRGNIRRS